MLFCLADTINEVIHAWQRSDLNVLDILPNIVQPKFIVVSRSTPERRARSWKSTTSPEETERCLNLSENISHLWLILLQRHGHWERTTSRANRRGKYLLHGNRNGLKLSKIQSSTLHGHSRCTLHMLYKCWHTSDQVQAELCLEKKNISSLTIIPLSSTNEDGWVLFQHLVIILLFECDALKLEERFYL